MIKTTIIGGGASGLMAAIAAAEEGNEVTVLEHKDVVGKKLSLTGNGKCNLTNMKQEKSYYYSNNSAFPCCILNKFNHEATIAFFEDMGLRVKDKNGYIYPNSECAADVTELLVGRCRALGVNILYKSEVKKIIKSDSKINVEYIKDDKRMIVESDNVIIAAGSKAMPKSGSDGSGYYFAKCLGHKIIEPLPALTGFKVNEKYIKNLSGVRAQGRVSVFADGVNIGSDEGEIQFTSYGISGIPAFQISGNISRNIYNGKKVSGYIDFFNDMSEDDLKAYIKEKIKKCPYKTIKEQFLSVINGKITEEILFVCNIDRESVSSDLEDDKINNISKIFKNFRFSVEEVNSFDNAQVCTGGVDTEEIDENTLESKLVPGVFFAGEVMDVDGICGGYNLQWAWSSGYVAGKSVAHRSI